MKSLYCLLALCLFFSTGRGQVMENLSGRYHSSEISKIPENPLVIYFLGTTEISGTDLVLKENGNYTYRNCSLIVHGNWKAKNDTLWLFAETNRWRNDSLNQYGFNGKHPQILKKIVTFEIKDGILERKFPVKFNEREMTAIETLVKDTLGR